MALIAVAALLPETTTVDADGYHLAYKVSVSDGATTLTSTIAVVIPPGGLAKTSSLPTIQAAVSAFVDNSGAANGKTVFVGPIAATDIYVLPAVS